MGYTYAGVRSGDRVCVIAGVNVPFILRPVTTMDEHEFYELVSYTYINGLMRGEAQELKGLNFSKVSLV